MFVSVHIEVVKKDVLYLLAVYFIKKTSMYPRNLGRC